MFRHFLHLRGATVTACTVEKKKKMNKQYQRLLTFAMVGGCGFLVDAASLYLLSLWFPLPLARGGAFWLAASSNWWLNRQVTFRHVNAVMPAPQQWGQFLVASCIGFIPNVGCYWLLMEWVEPGNMILSSAVFNSAVQDSTIFVRYWPYLAMIPGILLGMVINFTLADRWVFRSASA